MNEARMAPHGGSAALSKAPYPAGAVRRLWKAVFTTTGLALADRNGSWPCPRATQHVTWPPGLKSHNPPGAPFPRVGDGALGFLWSPMTKNTAHSH